VSCTAVMLDYAGASRKTERRNAMGMPFAQVGRSRKCGSHSVMDLVDRVQRLVPGRDQFSARRVRAGIAGWLQPRASTAISRRQNHKLPRFTQ
jgi:hypothetical protein